MNPSFLAPSVANSVPELGATFSITSAVSVFLTPSSLGLQSITMTAAGQSVFLPPIYSIVPGPAKFSVKNNGGYPFGIRDSNGVLLIAITPGGSATISLDNSSNWSYVGSSLEYGLITIDNTFSSTFSTSVLLTQFAALDNNTSIHFAALASGFSAFVVDNLGKVVTTPVTVSAASSSVPKTAFRISATSAIVFFGASATDHQAVVLTLSGTSPSLVLAVGTAQALTATMSASWDGENFSGAPKIAQLASTLYLASYVVAATSTSVVAISVAGAVVTIGTPANIITTNNVATATTTYPLTATTGAVLYLSGSGAPFAVNAVVISIAGTTCTVNTPAVAGTASQQTQPVVSVLLSPTKIIIIADGGTTTQNAHALTIAGTVVTWGAALVVEALARNQSYTNDNATRYNSHLWALGTNTSGLWYLDNLSISRAVVLTENAGTMTKGTTLFNSISATTVGNAGGGFILPQGTAEFCSFTDQLATTAGFANVVNTNKISGTVITQGYGKPLRNGLPIAPNNVFCSKVSQGDYILMAVGASSNTGGNVIPVFRSNGDAINYRGEISCPMFTQPSGSAGGFNLGVSSNRSVYLAPGLTSTGGAGTSQLRLINVEIAQ